jgi:hypothetical protein
MNTEDQFEQRLRRQPVKPIPSAWRQEILAATEHACAAGHASRITHHSLLATIRHQLLTLLWPHPKAWAGLVAIWVVILTLQIASRDRTEIVARNTPPPSPEMLIVLRQQRRLLAELVERPESHAAEPPKAIPPRPRSRCREAILAA